MWSAMSSTDFIQTAKDQLSSRSDEETEKKGRGGSVLRKQGNIERENDLLENLLHRQYFLGNSTYNDHFFSASLQ